MDLFDTTQIALERAMSGTSARQAALAENLANANTPGYQRKDVDFQGALRSALAGGKSAVERSSIQTVTDTSARAARRRLQRRPRARGRDHRPRRPRARRARLDRQHAQQHPARRDGHRLMGIFDALDISASGLIAERTRMDVTSQNLANAQSSGYRRQDVVLRESGGGFANVLGQAIGGVRRLPARRRGRRGHHRPGRAAPRVRPGSPGRRRAGLRAPPERQRGHRDDRPHLRVPRLRGERHGDADTAKQMFSKTLEILR